MRTIIETHDLIDKSIRAGIEDSYFDNKLIQTNVLIEIVDGHGVFIPAKSWGKVKDTIDRLLKKELLNG